MTEAAAVLGVSRRRVQQFIDKGRLKIAYRDTWGFYHVAADSVEELKGQDRPTGRPKKSKS